LSSEKNQLEHFSQKRVIVKLKNSSVVAESARKKMFSLAKKPAVVQQQLESPLFKKIKEIPRFNMAVYEVDPDNLDILSSSCFSRQNFSGSLFFHRRRCRYFFFLSKWR